MAVINKYQESLINADGITLSNRLPNLAVGADALIANAVISIAASDSNGSLYRVFKNLDASIIPTSIFIANTAMAGSTSFALGLYLPNLSAVQAGPSANAGAVFMSAVSLASAHASLHPNANVDGMQTAWASGGIVNVRNRLMDWAGDALTSRQPQYDLVLTGTTLGGVAGTVVVQMTYIIG